MFKKIFKPVGVIVFFIVFIASLSAPITGIGWLINSKVGLKLWYDSTIIGLYGSFIGIMLHAIFCGEMKLGRRLLMVTAFLSALLLSGALLTGQLLFQPTMFPILTLWWTLLAAGFFFLSFLASDDCTPETKTRLSIADR